MVRIAGRLGLRRAALAQVDGEDRDARDGEKLRLPVLQAAIPKLEAAAGFMIANQVGGDVHQPRGQAGVSAKLIAGLLSHCGDRFVARSRSARLSRIYTFWLLASGFWLLGFIPPVIRGLNL